MKSLLLATSLGLLSLANAQYEDRLIGIMGPPPDAVELAARAAITSPPDHPVGGHFNQLRKREFCKADCDWAAFCVKNGAYAGCCANKYTTCNVATTCIDYTQHLDTIVSYSTHKTIMCPSFMPYCTSTHNSGFGFDFVDCGFSPLPFVPPPTTTSRPVQTSVEVTSKVSTTSTTTSAETSTTSDDFNAQKDDDQGDDGPTEDDVGGSATLGGSKKGSKSTTSLKKKKKKGMSVGVIAGIAVGVLVILLCLLVFFCMKRRSDKKAKEAAPLMAQHTAYAPPTQFEGYPPGVVPVVQQPPYRESYAPKMDNSAYPSPAVSPAFPPQPMGSPPPPTYQGYVPPPPPGVVEAGGEAVQPPIRY